MLNDEEIINILRPIEEYFQELGIEITSARTAEPYKYKHQVFPKTTETPILISKGILNIFLEIKYGISYFELEHQYDILSEKLDHWDITHSYYCKDASELKKYILRDKFAGHHGYRVKLSELMSTIKQYSILEHHRVSNFKMLC